MKLKYCFGLVIVCAIINKLMLKKVAYLIILKICDCGDIYELFRFCFKNQSHKNPMNDFILIYITEISIKSYACTLIFRPSQKNFSRISSYLLCEMHFVKGGFFKSWQ